MFEKLLQPLVDALTQRGLASAPAVWGKLPEHGDFVHHRASLVERKAWLEWVQAMWQRPSPAPARRKAASEQGWMHLAPPPINPAPRGLPVAFVLPPGTLPFAPQHCVQGVMIESQDKVARTCPLVIYQRVTPAWVQRLWAPGSAMGGQDLLFWWARMAVSAVHGPISWPDWLGRLDPVWLAHAPGFSQFLGAAPRRAQAQDMWPLVGAIEASDPASLCKGVQHLPWSDWPARVLRPTQATAAFWTQDDNGHYVHASTSLTQLWSRQP